MSSPATSEATRAERNDYRSLNEHEGQMVLLASRESAKPRRSAPARRD